MHLGQARLGWEFPAHPSYRSDCTKRPNSLFLKTRRYMQSGDTHTPLPVVGIVRPAQGALRLLLLCVPVLPFGAGEALRTQGERVRRCPARKCEDFPIISRALGCHAEEDREGIFQCFCGDSEEDMSYGGTNGGVFLRWAFLKTSTTFLLNLMLDVFRRAFPFFCRTGLSTKTAAYKGDETHHLRLGSCGPHRLCDFCCCASPVPIPCVLCAREACRRKERGSSTRRSRRRLREVQNFPDFRCPRDLSGRK